MVSRKINSTNFRGLDYLAVLEYLLTYVEERIHARGEMIVETNDMLEDIGGNIGVNLAEVGFYDDDLKKHDTIKRQAIIFEELFSHLKESNMLAKIKESINSDEYLEEFNALFNKRDWPLVIN